MKQIGTLGLLICVAFWSCKPKFPGYKKVDDQLYYKLLAFGEPASTADSCGVFEVYTHTADSALAEQFRFSSRDNLPKWISKKDSIYSRLQPYLVHMNPGDSAKFILDRKGRAPLSLTVFWKNCYSATQFDEVYETWMQNRRLYEENRIRHYALEKGFSSSLVQPAVIYRVEQSGSGSPLSYGDRIAIHYSGYFLNGQRFDDSQRGGEALVFELGTDGQVIAGLEYGLIGAKRGEVRSVVIPSVFAFGEKGSSTGIVPPYTPVLYEVQILAEHDS